MELHLHANGSYTVLQASIEKYGEKYDMEETDRGHWRQEGGRVLFSADPRGGGDASYMEVHGRYLYVPAEAYPASPRIRFSLRSTIRD
jgi:hypothetical protein